MKNIILILLFFLTSQYTHSQLKSDTNSVNIIEIKSSNIKAVSSIPSPPTISGYLDNREYKTYRFIAQSPGATEYEWHFSAQGDMIKSITYPYNDEALVYFNYGSSLPIQVVCKAKNASGWSEYTVTFWPISF